MTVAHVAFRLMKDEAFRSQVLANPRVALAQAQVPLSPEDVELLCNIPWGELLPDLGSQSSPGMMGGPGWWDCQLNRFTPPSPSSLA